MGDPGSALPRHDLPLLDGVRAIAALMVLTTHVGFQTGVVVAGPVGAAVARMDLGVALFFALSGFLLVRPWLHDRDDGGPSTRRYLVRRAVRILPAYWVVLAVALLTTARGAPPAHAVANTLLVQVYPGWLLPGLTQTWSLCTEVAFYLLLPLVAPLVGAALRRGSFGALGAGLAASAVASWVWAGLVAAGRLPAQSGTWLPGHLDWFAVGVALAVALEQARRAPSGAMARLVSGLRAAGGSVLVLALTVYWLVCTPLGGPRTLATTTAPGAAGKEVAYALLAGLVLAAVAAADQRRGPFAAVLGSAPTQLLGRVSYGVFLWHLLVLAAVMDVLRTPLFSGDFWPVLLLTASGTTAVAWMSWVLLEERLLRLVHRPAAALSVASGGPPRVPRP